MIRKPTTKAIPLTPASLSGLVGLSLITMYISDIKISWNVFDQFTQAIIAYFSPDLKIPSVSNIRASLGPQLTVQTQSTHHPLQVSTQPLDRPTVNPQFVNNMSHGSKKVPALPDDTSPPAFNGYHFDLSQWMHNFTGNTSFPRAALKVDVIETAHHQLLSSQEARGRTTHAFEPSQKNETNSILDQEKPSKVLMRPWHTYSVPGHFARIQQWLKSLAPETPVDIEEIPLREALIKTMLSPRFQSQIASNFWTASANHKERGQFLRAYIDEIDWSKTSYPSGLMTAPGVDNACYINEAALDYALRLPQRHKILQEGDDCWGL